jgi:hypothetical protein
MEQVSEAKSKKLNELPDASGWSEAMDALLLQRRVEKKLPWRAVAPIGGMNARRCQSRLKVLQAREGRPALAQAKRGVSAVEERDGLAWLIKKHRLNGAQQREAMLYRQGFRDAGEVTMRSCLNVGVGGGETVGLPDAAVFAMTQARRAIFIARYQVLRGQVDMLTVMDGVCGHGYTLRYLAGGDRHRADVLEVALKLALDLLVAFRAGPPAHAASAA